MVSLWSTVVTTFFYSDSYHILLLLYLFHDVMLCWCCCCHCCLLFAIWHNAKWSIRSDINKNGNRIVSGEEKKKLCRIIRLLLYQFHCKFSITNKTKCNSKSIGIQQQQWQSKKKLKIDFRCLKFFFLVYRRVTLPIFFSHFFLNMPRVMIEFSFVVVVAIKCKLALLAHELLESEKKRTRKKKIIAYYNCITTKKKDAYKWKQQNQPLNRSHIIIYIPIYAACICICVNVE